MEKISIKGMIEGVIYDLSQNEPISKFALKIKLISHHLKNKDFSNWINNELDGYKDVKDLPPHRILQSYVIADLVIDNGVKGATLSNHTMPLIHIKNDEIRKKISWVNICDSIISLETIVNSTEPQIYVATTEYERYYLSKIYQYSTILSAKKPISKTEFELIIFKFRSKLLEMFLNFNDSIFNDELDFDIMNKKQEIDKVVSHTINAGVYIAENSSASINHSNMVAGNNNQVSISSVDKKELENILYQIDNLSQNLDDDRKDIADEIVKIKQELDNPTQNVKYIKSAFNAIKGIAIGVGANQITPLVNQGLEYVKNMFV